LPHHDRLVQQLVGLERRVSRGSGKDIIDHPPGQHDDIANAVAGAALLATGCGYNLFSGAFEDGWPLSTTTSSGPLTPITDDPVAAWQATRAAAERAALVGRYGQPVSLMPKEPAA
jgi:hypothetical protein